MSRAWLPDWFWAEPKPVPSPPPAPNRYTEPNPDYGDEMTVVKFREAVDMGVFTDYDGSGSASNGTHIDPNLMIYPSMVSEIPADATHIIWYNR